MKIVSNDNKRFSFLNMTYERLKNYFHFFIHINHNLKLLSLC